MTVQATLTDLQKLCINPICCSSSSEMLFECVPDSSNGVLHINYCKILV